MTHPFAYRAIRVYPDKTYKPDELFCDMRPRINYNIATSTQSDNISYLTVYYDREVPPDKENYNKVASKLCGYKIYGEAILVNHMEEEVENPMYVSRGDDSDTDNENDGEEQYVMCRLDFDEEMFCYLCNRMGLRVMRTV